MCHPRKPRVTPLGESKIQNPKSQALILSQAGHPLRSSTSAISSSASAGKRNQLKIFAITAAFLRLSNMEDSDC
jgi:hypothetical protein